MCFQVNYFDLRFHHNQKGVDQKFDMHDFPELDGFVDG